MPNFSFKQVKKPIKKHIIFIEDTNIDLDEEMFYYNVTQTFAPMSLKEKVLHIQSLGRYMCRFLGEYKFYYTIEYHKKNHKDPKSDISAFKPHIHGTLITPYCIKQDSLAYLSEGLRRIMGGVQIVPQEDLDEVKKWMEWYCMKNVESNDARFGFPHGPFLFEVKMDPLPPKVHYTLQMDIDNQEEFEDREELSKDDFSDLEEPVYLIL